MQKIYNISGFDCPNCAAKAERHIAKQENVLSAHLDFSTNRLYVTFKDEPWDVETLRKVIEEVEDDPLHISEVGDKKSTANKIFTKKMYWTLARIIISVVIALVCIFLLTGNNMQWLRFGIYLFAILLIGYDIFYKVIYHIKHKANILDHFLLISIAAVGSLTLAIIGLVEGENGIHIFDNGFKVAMDDSFEALMVITLFQIGSIIENVATNKSKAAVMQAVELRVDKANLLIDDMIKVVSPEELKLDDIILVKTGELIPIDGEVIEGNAYIDTSSLTGEFVPVYAKENIDVFSGCLVKDGTIKIKVKKIYQDSTISKIIKLIENGGEKKSKADEFIAKFAKIYTPIVVILAILVLVLGGLISSLTSGSNQWMTWVHTGLEVLVIGCPCAIVISVPLAYFASIGLASKNGIVIKGGNYLDSLSNIGKLITDKTGTLTHGQFVVQKINTIGDIKEDELMDYIYAIESYSTHPIAKAIFHDKTKEKSKYQVKDFLEVAGLGCSGTYKGHRVLVGNDKLLIKHKVDFIYNHEAGSIVYCALDNKYIGNIVLSDVIKSDAQPMVNLLHSKGVEIVLLTGDHEENAKDICNKLSIDRWHSELLPEQKTKILETEMDGYKKSVAFIGDGINDAPSIIRSDIGIAMGGIGSDVAVENADVIIMNDDPAKVYDAMMIARMGRHTAIFNIVFALIIKVAVFVLALIFKDEKFMMYVAVLADTGLTVLLVINSLLLLYRKVRR